MMTKRQMHNYDNVHLPFFCVNEKPKFFIYTPGYLFPFSHLLFIFINFSKHAIAYIVYRNYHNAGN